ncbi:MAG: CehA/McbA family metallohydrolase [Bacillota bacterium]|nr:CehA/McbA family metallohydrolase [Bacillota bacterium]
MKRKILILGLLFAALALFSSCAGKTSGYFLLKGDLHVHTKFSYDGVYSIADTIKYSKEDGFDFIALTDHNIVSQNDEIPKYKKSGIILIPGMEQTMEQGAGHANILGIVHPLLKYITKDNANELWPVYYADAKSMGALVQINHPFDPKYYWSPDLGFIGNYDMIEVWNGVYTDDDKKAMDFWQGELAKGRKIPVTGGSDTHEGTTGRSPVNCVLVKEKTASGILESVSDGHNYVSLTAGGPGATLEYGRSVMGDSVIAMPNTKLKFSVTGLKQGDKVMLITADGVLNTYNAENGKVSGELLVDANKKFYRISAYRGESLILFTNPIYFD